MQVEITPQIIVAALGLSLAVETAIVAVAVMIRGTAKDLARESKERETSEKATEARFAVVEREVQVHAVDLRALEVRADAAERTLTATAASVAAHAQMLAALSGVPTDRARRR